MRNQRLTTFRLTDKTDSWIFRTSLIPIKSSYASQALLTAFFAVSLDSLTC